MKTPVHIPLSDAPVNTVHRDNHAADCRRIARLAADHGQALSLDNAYRAWRCVSDRFACGWYVLPDQDTLVWCLLTGQVQSDLAELIDALQFQSPA